MEKENGQRNGNCYIKSYVADNTGLQSELLVSPLIAPIIVPFLFLYITLLKEFKL